MIDLKVILREAYRQGYLNALHDMCECGDGSEEEHFDDWISEAWEVGEVGDIEIDK